MKQSARRIMLAAVLAFLAITAVVSPSAQHVQAGGFCYACVSSAPTS